MTMIYFHLCTEEAHIPENLRYSNWMTIKTCTKNCTLFWEQTNYNSEQIINSLCFDKLCDLILNIQHGIT